MCDIENTMLFGFPIKPYFEANGTLSGYIYEAFIETLSYCCKFNTTSIQLPFRNMTQSEILESIDRHPHAVGLPISIDSAMKYLPETFIPFIETEGQVWVYRPKNSTESGSIKIFTSVGVPLLVGLLILTGYAALILWLLDSLAKIAKGGKVLNMREIFDNYWCAFISATTVGYGDLVPRTVIGKVFAMLWILFGICGMSTLTGLVSGMMNALLEDSSIKRPIYQEIIAARKGSLDYQVVIRKGAYVLETDSFEELFDKLRDADVTGFIIDYASYWSYTTGWFTLGESFRKGIAIPTTIGVIYNVDNSSLLQCLKRRVFFTQNSIWTKFYWDPKTMTDSQVQLLQTGDGSDAAVQNAQDKLIGPDVYLYLGIAAGILVVLWCAIALAEYVLFLRNSGSNRTSRGGDPHNGHDTDDAYPDAYPDPDPDHANETCINPDEEIWQRNELWNRNGV